MTSLRVCSSLFLILLLVTPEVHGRKVKRSGSGGGGRSRSSSVGGDGNQTEGNTPDDDMVALRKYVDISYLRCAFQGQALLRVPDPHIKTTSTSKAHKFPYFVGTDDLPTTSWRTAAIDKETDTAAHHNRSGGSFDENGFDRPAPPPHQRRSASCHPTSLNCSTNPCGLQWIEDSEVYSGLDNIILVGDSTLLRLFQHMIRAKKEDYETKVGQLEEDFMNRTVVLSSGRKLVIHFIRALHVSTAIGEVDRAFKLATTPQSLIVFSFGPHDTSWLVFRRPMPGFRRSHVGTWNHARIYWNRFTTTLVHYIAFRLRMYEERGHGFVNEDNAAGRANGHQFRAKNAFHRPVVVFREQYLANCAHPKYTKYPLITRCGDLLMPIVIPHYRAYLAAMTSMMNIPTIGLDELLHPPTSSAIVEFQTAPVSLCMFVDAGHMNRECHRYELQLLIQAYRSTKRLGIVQGYDQARHGGATLYKLIQQAGLGARWERVLEMVRALPPVGYRPLSFLSCHYKGELLVDPINATVDDGPLCEPEEEDDGQQPNQRRKRWNPHQLRDAARLFDKFDGGSLELDVGAMDSIDIFEQRRTRCSRAALFASPFGTNMSLYLNTSIEGDDTVSVMDAAAADDAIITAPLRSSSHFPGAGIPAWITFAASTVLMAMFAVTLYRQ
ncbi:GPI-anchored surface protein, putative [Bodo saltans]|uniref:GPI-anchored surface protein, putative n=1 Tax=Bodo saltans TaxID=75058 RepID=A0A0S4J228_BODSA|nr:GPI-anchored surface protein, putative [Bodo saltans]|eukprot:CUG53713.1 GPI-anchored surface protein, putative [Bodo saltans]